MLLEESISQVMEDQVLRKKVGFFRAIPLLYLLYHPVFTYHAKRWYVKYIMANAEFSTLFNHTWVYSKKISNPKIATEFDSLSILLIRGIVEKSEEETLIKIIKRAIKGGFKHIYISIDGVEGFRLDERRTRTLESLVPTISFDNEYSNWLERIKVSLPTVKCKSKSVILESYGIYELARASITSPLRTKNSIEDFEDMMALDFPLIVMDILYKISIGIRKTYPLTHIDIATIKRFVTPWFDNKKEAKQIIIRCYEKVPDLNNKTWDIRRKLGRRIEEKLLSWCKNREDRDICRQICEVVYRCAI